MNNSPVDGLLIQQLTSNLESLVEMHEVLLEILNKEQELPASCSLDELHNVHSIRDFASKRIFDLEEARIQIIERYKEAMGIRTNLSLNQIIERCDRSAQENLRNLRSRLKEIIELIRPAGKKNAEQAIARMACFTEIQGEIQKTFKRHPVYSVNGVVSRPKGTYLFQKSI